MNARLEELFSPDKLRQNWQSPCMPVVIVPSQNKVNLSIYNHYLELQRLITEKFPDAGSLLADTFNNLTTEIDFSFRPNTASYSGADAKQKAAIIGLLEELEELLWAIHLSGQGI